MTRIQQFRTRVSNFGYSRVVAHLVKKARCLARELCSERQAESSNNGANGVARGQMILGRRRVAAHSTVYASEVVQTEWPERLR